MSLRTDALSGVKWNGIKNVVAALVKILQVAILTRFLTKEDFGLMGIALLFNSFSRILVDLGFGTVVMHEQSISRERFASLYWANIALGLIIALLLSISSSIIANIYQREELRGIINLTAIMIFTNSISSLQQMVQQKNMNFRFLAILTILSSLLALVLNVLFASFGWGVYSMVWASLLDSIFISAVYLYIGVFVEKNIIFFFRFKHIRQALRIGIFQMGSSILEFFAREMDTIIVSSGLPLAFFGCYSLCKNLSRNIYAFVNPIITGVLTPVYSKIQSDSNRVKASYIKSLDMIGGVNFFLYGLVASAAVPILGVLYGASYTEFGLVLVCLCLYYAQQSMGNPVGSLIVAKGRTDLAFYWSIFRILFVGGYLYVFSHYFSTTVFVIMLAALPVFLQYPSYRISMRKLLDISFSELFLVIEKPLFICLPLLLLFFISEWISNYYLCGIIIGFIFTALYVLLYYAFRRDLLIEMINSGLSMIKRSK